MAKLIPVLVVGALFLGLGTRLYRIGSQEGKPEQGGPERWLAAFFFSLAAALPLMRALMIGCGLTAATTIWLSFFPPRAYLARLQTS